MYLALAQNRSQLDIQSLKIMSDERSRTKRSY